MSQHRYPPQTLVGDYGRAGGGLLVMVAILWYGPGTVVSIALMMIAAICLYFLTITVERNRAVITVDDEGITLTSFRSSKVLWSDLARMTLSYYAVKREKTGGWMELTLRDSTAVVKLDSRLEGFFAIVKKAAQVAREGRIPLNKITLENLNALKITGE